MKKRKLFEYSMKTLMYLSLCIVLLLVISIVGYVLYKGLPYISVELLTTKPSALNNKIGILPNILNTLYIIILTLIIVIPIGVGAAIYLNEYAKNKKVISLIEYAIQTLSGIPSIIYGLIGMLLFSNNIGTSLLAGALTLVIMNLPTIISTTQESLKTVPDSYRHASYGLGAGKWRTIYSVVLPSCIDGIITGTILAIGRILGESAALLYTAGFAHKVNGFFSGIFKSGSTLSVALYVYAKEEGEFEVAFAIAAILLILAFVLNLLASLVGKYFKKRRNL